MNERVVAVVLGVEAERRPRSRRVFLVTVTPVVLAPRRAGGPCAWLTRFCTSTAARSGSRPMSKVTVIVADAVCCVLDDVHVLHALDAVDRLLERRRDRRSRPPARWRRCRTRRRSPAAAPAAGTARSAASGWRSRPPSMMTSEQTVARIGRRMKTSTNIATSSRRRRRGAPAGWARRPPSSARRRHDQALAGLDPGQHRIVVADELAERHRPLARHQLARPCPRPRTRSTAR